MVRLKTPRAFFFFLLLPKFVFVANWAALSALISRLTRGLDIDALLDSSVALSTLKLRFAMDARLAQLMS